ncbi:hypothetical protein Pse7429DRAFT_3483, partial [Pseudanabaena biceps PCC 7429]
CRVLPFLTTDTDWQDGHDGLDGLDSDIALICNNHLDIFPHPFLFRTTETVGLMAIGKSVKLASKPLKPF